MCRVSRQVEKTGVKGILNTSRHRDTDVSNLADFTIFQRCVPVFVFPVVRLRV